ncbi:MAG: hypothetical protein AB7U78_03975 [Hyphomicrobiaceae bacterium]
MSGRRDYIHDLRAKLMFLTEQTEKGTWEELERHVPRSTRQQACNPNSPYYSLLGRPHQKALAKAFDFDIAWPEWRDPAADREADVRRDTCAAFKTRYAQHMSGLDQARRAVPRGAEPVTANDEAAVGRPTVKLGPGPHQPVKQLTRTIKLASVSIEGQQWGEGSVALLLTLACNKFRELTVIRGRIEISPGAGRMTMPSYLEWQAPKAVAGHATGRANKVMIERGGTRLDPHLDITGVDGPIGTIVFDGDLPAFEGLVPGDEIAVTFGTWLADVGTSWQLDNAAQPEGNAFGIDSLGVLSKDGKLIAERTEELTAYKRWAIGIIRQDTLGEAGPDGYLELVTHSLIVGRGV